MTARRGAAAAALAVGVCLLLGAPAASRAQLPHLDPLPWPANPDSTARLTLEVQLDRWDDAATDWSVDRLLLTAQLPAGGAGVWFLRVPTLTFDNAGLSATTRWPGAAGSDPPDGWDGEDRRPGFGQVEVGGCGPLRLPVVGRGQFGLALGLPTGQNRLYPWSSASLPVRLQLRRDLLPSRPLDLWLTGGYLLHLDASRDALDPAAFPNGWLLGADLAAPRGRGAWGLGAAWEDRNGRTAATLAAVAWLPWTARGAVGLRAAREVGGGSDVPARWWLSVTWRFTGLPPTPEDAAPAR